MAEVCAVGLEADLAVGGVLEVGVNGIVHVDFFGDGIGGHD